MGREMQRRDLELAAVRVAYWRGLLAVPVGLCFLVIGLGNLRWGPFAQDWVFLAGIVATAALVVLVRSYYDANYGRVSFPRRQQLRYDIVTFVLTAAALVGGVLLDGELDLPISLFVICFALSGLAWFAVTVGLTIEHAVVCLALLVVGLLPVWGNLADRVSVGWLPIGAATMVAGLFGHLRLVRTYGSGRRDHEHTDVAA
jgi:hypothetical protein